jgi:ABC-2 type transport system permease protein
MVKIYQFFIKIYAQTIKEVLIVMRDKHALAVLFLMPACFVFLLSLALQDLHKASLAPNVKILLLADDASSQTAADLRVFLQNSVSITLVENTRDADATVSIPRSTDRELKAFIKDFSTTPENRMTLSFKEGTKEAFKHIVNSILSTFLYQRLLRQITIEMDVKLKKENSPSDFIQELKSNQVARPLPNPLEQNVPGWSLFAMFFIALPLAGNVVRERSEGTLKRILCFPNTRLSVILGKVFPYMIINCIQFILMLLVGRYALAAVSDLTFAPQGNPWLLAAITIVVGVTTTSFAIAVASVSKSVEHATALVGAVVILTSVVGGIMVPVHAMPTIMKDLAHYSPIFWAHQAYLDVMVYKAVFSDVATYLYKLLVFAGACAAFGAWRFKWL